LEESRKDLQYFRLIAEDFDPIKVKQNILAYFRYSRKNLIHHSGFALNVG